MSCNSFEEFNDEDNPAFLTQDSISPDESASQSMGILNSYPKGSKGCWARPAFKQEFVVVADSPELKWRCLLCKNLYHINPKTTGNIREHLKSKHPELASGLQARNGSKTSSNSLEGGVQTHIDKKLKVVKFTQKRFDELLLKFAILTDQSFLSVQHPVFVSLLQFCRPDIVLPNRKQVKDALMKSYSLKKEVLKDKLKMVWYVTNIRLNRFVLLPMSGLPNPWSHLWPLPTITSTKSLKWCLVCLILFQLQVSMMANCR